MWKIDLRKLRGIQWRDYAIRFLFGGIISVIAAGIAQWTSGRIGGIFTAFPAILLASLTLINQEDGKRAAKLDAQGAIVGAIALVLTSLLLIVLLSRLSGVIALLLGLVWWLVCSIGLYFLSVKRGWLRLDQER